MAKLQITYEERYWDELQPLWHELLPCFSGVEFCLSTEALETSFFRQRIREIAKLGYTLRFHLPHHILSEALDTNTTAPLQELIPLYNAYYSALLGALSEALSELHIQLKIGVIHHPIAGNYKLTLDLLSHMVKEFGSSNLEPLLEPTDQVPISTDTLKDFGSQWFETNGYSLYCLDLTYLDRLGLLTDQAAQILLPFTQVLHYHSLEHPHSSVDSLAAEPAYWLQRAVELDIPINFELLKWACDTRGQDYLRAIETSMATLSDAITR